MTHPMNDVFEAYRLIVACCTLVIDDHPEQIPVFLADESDNVMSLFAVAAAETLVAFAQRLIDVEAIDGTLEDWVPLYGAHVARMIEQMTDGT